MEDRADTISVHDTMQVLQSDFGMVPYSVIGGVIQVRDALDIRFEVVAVRSRG